MLQGGDAAKKALAVASHDSGVFRSASLAKSAIDGALRKFPPGDNEFSSLREALENILKKHFNSNENPMFKLSGVQGAQKYWLETEARMSAEGKDLAGPFSEAIGAYKSFYQSMAEVITFAGFTENEISACVQAEKDALTKPKAGAKQSVIDDYANSCKLRDEKGKYLRSILMAE